MSALSSQYNNDIIDNKIQIGSIVSINCDGIDHPKWNIILDIMDDKCLIASVFINSEINFFHINSPELVALQYPIKKIDFPFLDHDSYIDCSNLFEKHYKEYKVTLINNAIRKIGELSEPEIESIYEFVRKSKNIKGKTKKKYPRLFPKIIEERTPEI